MTKQSGLGDHLSVAGYDLSGDIGSLSRIAGGPAVLDVTAINASAMERIGALRDGGIEFNAFFNPATNRAHLRLSSLPRTDQIVSYHRGAAIGGQAASVVAKQINYDGTRGNDGAFTFTTQALASGYGLEWGTQVTPWQRTDTTATSGAGVDFAASSAFGLQAYLHVYSFTGTSVTVKLQSSSDDAVGDAYADVTGGAFTAATGVTAQRIATATNLAVEQWLRVVTTGTFTSAVFSVQVTRNLTAPAF